MTPCPPRPTPPRCPAGTRALWYCAGWFACTLLPAAAGNPVLRGADPHAAVLDRQVWIYPTGRGEQLFVWSSRDLQRWEKSGPILDIGEIAWIKADGAPVHHLWAPCVARRNNKVYLYYSVGPQNPTPSRLGVAVADTPAGPFRDSGRALLTGGGGFEAIDPMVFEDPASGKFFLYAGGSAGATLRVFELNEAMTGFAREIKTATPPRFTEGAFLHVRRGTYYLSYSHGNYRDASYSVHYATSPTATGPWQYRGAILESGPRHKGPGHHSFIHLPGIDRWFIVYHRYNNQTGDGPYRAQRQIAIDRVDHTPDGLIRRIEMTDTGVSLAVPRG